MLAAGGCGSSDQGGGDAMRLSWDLSKGHSMRAVDWPRPDSDMVELKPITAVDLTLPAGRSFAADHDIQRVVVTRLGDQVDEVRVFAQPAAIDDAYARARHWAQEFDLPVAKLQRWHAGGGDTDQRLTLVGPPGQTIGADGPQPSLEIIGSGESGQQAVVILNFSWV